jgi:hypothetical protein
MQQIRMEHSPEAQKCIDNCLNCYSTCTQTTAQCLQMGGEHTEASHLTIMADCTEVCALSADFMLRGSEFDSSTVYSLRSSVRQQRARPVTNVDEEYMKRWRKRAENALTLQKHDKIKKMVPKKGSLVAKRVTIIMRHSEP